jgi:hypothetical protein
MPAPEDRARRRRTRGKVLGIYASEMIGSSTRWRGYGE